MATGSRKHTRRSRLLLPKSKPMVGLGGEACWLIEALRRLLRRGRNPLETAWEWIDWFDELSERARAIRQADGVPPAGSCPLVPVWMPVEVPGWPGRNQAIPVQFEERELFAVDNRRLVGKVVEVVLDHVALHRSAALNAHGRGVREGAVQHGEADRYALKAQELARTALRSVDLDALAQAVAAEVDASAAPAAVGAKDHVGHDRVEVEFLNDQLAVVKEGRMRKEVRGQRRVWLLRQVFEAGSRGVTWEDLLRMDMGNAAGKLRGLRSPASTPRMATNPSSLQRLGRHVYTDLGRLKYLWQQNGHGARWADDAE